MDNITIKNLPNGYVELKANAGYSLFSLDLERVVSEAVVKTEGIKDFIAKAED